MNTAVHNLDIKIDQIDMGIDKLIKGLVIEMAAGFNKDMDTFLFKGLCCKEGVSDLVSRTCNFCEMIIEGIGELSGAEVIWKSQLNQGLLRFRDLKQTASEIDHDTQTQKIMDAVNDSGVAFFSSTTWENRLAMRVSVVNWRTSESDVKKTIEIFRKLLS